MSTKPGIALLGCGRWGQNHLRVWTKLGVLKAAYDINPSVLRSLRAGTRVEFSPRFYEAFTRPDVQGIVIATPADTHAELAARALAAGKHVLVEKPLALGSSQAEALVRQAAGARRILMTGHVLEYHPAVEALEKLIRKGALGRIRYMTSDRLNYGTFRSSENVLWSFAPHDVSLMLRFMRAMPESVTCQGRGYVRDGIADVTLTTMHFARGVYAHIYVNWLYPFKVQRFVLVGEKQMAVFDDLKPWDEKLVLYRYGRDQRKGNVLGSRQVQGISVSLKPESPLERECRHFLDCMIHRRKPLTDGAVGLGVLKVLESADASCRSGGPRVALRDGLGEKARRTYTCHPTAVVDPGARIGAGTRVWHYVHVSEKAVIGRSCVLGQGVFVGRNVRIGNGCKIQNYVSVYEGVTLEDHVFCGPSVVFTNVINPRSEIERKNEFRPTLVRRGATLGANATILCGITIGEYAFVAAGAVVTRGVPAYALVKGIPARQSGWVCACGKKLSKKLRCACGRSYRRLRRKGASGLEPAPSR